MRGNLFCSRYGDIEKKGSRIQGAGGPANRLQTKENARQKKKDEIGDEERQQARDE